MKIFRHLLRMTLSPKERRRMKGLLSAVFLPVILLYMTSADLILLEIASAQENETTVVDETSIGETLEDGDMGEVESSQSEEEDSKNDEEKVEMIEDASAVGAEAVVDTVEETAVPVETKAAVILSKEEKSETLDEEELVLTDEKKPVPLGASWKIEGNLASINPVEKNKTYEAPQNKAVTVTFTELPENPGSLSIEEITLTQEQKEELGALSNKAYDITSDMEDGMFEYDLTLPKPEGIDRVEIRYAEDKDSLDEAKTVGGDRVDVKDKKVEAEGMDHFTVFVVTNAKDQTNLLSPEVLNASSVSKISSSDDERYSTNGHWPRYWFFPYQQNQYLEFTFSPNIPVDAIINGADLIFEYQRDAFKSGTGQKDARIRAWDGDGFDVEIADYDDLKLSSPNKDEIKSIPIPSELIDTPEEINNFKIRFYMRGVGPSSHPWLETRHDYVGLDIDFINSGSITILKDAVPEDEQDFNFTGNLGSFTLDDDGDIDNGLSDSRTFSNLTPGTYTVTEPDISGWDLTNISCSGGSDMSSHERNVVIKLSAGEDVVCTFTNTKTADTVPPPIPTGMRILDYQNRDLGCGGYTNQRSITVDWDDSGDSDFNHFDYQIREGTTIASPTISQYSGNIRDEDGYYKYRVRAVDDSGNQSDWTDWCGVTLDRSAPMAPIIEFPNPEQYFNTAPILNNWSDVFDSSGIMKYRIQYEYDDHHTFSGYPYRETTVSQRNHTPSLTEQGGVSFRVQAFDNAGNEGTWSEWRHYFYDTIAPETPTGIYFKDIVNNKNVSCGGFTSARNLDVYWDKNTEADFDHYEYISFNADGTTGPIRTFTEPYFYASWWTVPIEGTYGVQVRAVDKSGNKSEWSGGAQGIANSCKYTADWSAPTTPTVLGFKNPNLSCGAVTNNKVVIVDWTDSTDNIDGYDYSIDYPLSPGPGRGIWNTFFHSSQYTGSLNEGVHRIKVRARDLAGNVSGWSNVCDVTYDSIAPDVPQLISPENNSVIPGASLTNSWNTVDGAVKYIYESWHNTNTNNLANRRWEQVINAPATSKTATNVSDATFWWRVKAIDAAGNESDWSELWKVTVDNIAPNVEIISPTESFLSGTVEIRGTVSDNNPHHYWLVIQGSGGQVGPGQVNTSISFTDQVMFTWNTTAKADGIYTIKLEARDAAGNKIETKNIPGSSVKWKTVTVDNTAPTSTIDDGENNGTVYTNSWDGHISGTASDNLSGVDEVELSIQRGSNGQYWNGLSWQDGEIFVLASGTEVWSYDLSSPAEDSYIISSHAFDKAGNRENTYTLTIVFDKTIPEVVLFIDPVDPDGDNGWYDSHPIITLTGTDKYLNKVEYQLDSQTGTWIEYVAPIGIPDGKHAFYYRAADLAGNSSSVGLKNIKVDTDRPDEVSNLDAEYEEETETVRLTWNVDDSDAHRVYIYRGKSRNFDLNIGSLLAKQDASDDTYSDDDVSRGEKYYYKLAVYDEAGNRSEKVRVISVEIPEVGGEAVVTDEGTETLLSASTVQETEKSDQENGSINQDQEENQNPEVLGAEAQPNTQESGWWKWWMWLPFLVIIIFLVWLFRKKNLHT